MRRRTFEEMITYFNQTVSGMDIDRKYKMTLLGMVTALLQKHDNELAKNSPKVNSDSGELISRQAAYETLTEYYHHTTDVQHKALREALERVPSAQPEIDTVSRQAVLDAVDGLKKWSLLDKHGQHVGVGVFCNEIKTKVKDLPSSPTPKKGEWIEQDDSWDGVYYECSACGEPWTTIDGTPWDNGMNFCPHCGADMKEGEG